MNVFKLLKVTNLCLNRCYSNKNPIQKTWQLLSTEIPSLFKNDKPTFYPEHADVVIIGGGAIGSSIAYHLKEKCGPGLSVVVLEKDFTFKKALQNHSFTGISQHYSIIENMLLSQYSAEFLRNIKDKLGQEVDIQYNPHGNLVLANEKYAELLEQNVTMQRENGVKNERLSPEKIRERYPWINVTDIKLGCIASESEGWFNSWLLHKSFMLKSHDLGALYVNAEVTGFEVLKQRDLLMEGIEPGSFEKIDKIKYKTDNKEFYIKFAICILANGSSSVETAQLAKIGVGKGLNAIGLPIVKRKNRVYCIEGNNYKLGLNMPLVRDVNGTWIRRNGLTDTLTCGYQPMVYEASLDKLTEEELFKNIIHPSLSHRIPDLKDAQIISSNTELVDCNEYDESGILGPHPYYSNMYFATGFGNQGIEHAPGIGRAMCELIVDNNFIAIDLLRFGFDRLLVDRPLIEVNSY